jgi:twinkle protein
MLFKDGGAYCNRCKHTCNWKDEGFKPTPKVEKTDDQVKEELEDFTSCPIKEWPKRKLKVPALTRYGCRSGVSPVDRDSIGSYLLPYVDESLRLCGYKVRLADEKKFWNQGRPKASVLFGQQLCTGGKKLFITESPIDAVSLYQAIKDAWAGSKFAGAEPNVVGLPHGTSCAVELLSNQAALLSKYSEIILVMDADDAGRECVDKIAALIPDVKYVILPEGSDPNSMLMDGQASKLAKLAQFGSVEYKLAGISDIGDLIDEIVLPPEYGLALPFKKLTDLMYGLRSKEIIGIGGAVGIGKSTFKDEMIVCFAKQGVKQTVFDLEADVSSTGKSLASKLAGKDFSKPDISYTPKEIEVALAPLKGLVSICTHKGSKSWEDIKMFIRADVLKGSKIVHIDPLTALTAHLSSSEANDELNRIFSELSSMTHELDFTVIYYSHLNTPKTGAEHTRGGKVLESQFTGSRASIKWSNIIIGFEGNKDPALPDHERNVRKIVLLKDRAHGNVGEVYVRYDPITTKLLEIDYDQ